MTASAAIAWEFRRRHRWGFGVIVAYLTALAAFKLWMLLTGRTFALEDTAQFALVVVVPLGVMLTYLLAVFTYGISGDIAGRQSMYPPRLFTQPVPTEQLARWPMLYGTLSAVVFWFALRLFGVWPADVHVPVLWPALLAAALIAWTQALTWMPYGLPWLRIGAALLCLTVIEAAVMVGLQLRVAEWLMVAAIAPLLPAAYVVARVAVARARRGEVPDWRGALARRSTSARAARPFGSPQRAQAWFEWKRAGWSLPVLVAILLPFELVLLLVAQNALPLVLTILLGVLLTPPFMASFTAATVRKASSNLSDAYDVSPFIATRPLTSASLIAAKLRMTVWSTLVTWLLVLIAIPIALVWTDTWPLVSDRARYFANYWGTDRAVAVLTLVILICVLSTWRQMVQSLYIGLSGREWLVRWSVGVALTLLSLIAPVGIWIVETPAAIRFLMANLPFILAALATVKTVVAVWVAVRLWRSRVLSDRTLVTGAAIWLAAVLALYGALSWLFLADLFPRYVFALAAILIVPLARVAAAPLALNWNRHR